MFVITNIFYILIPTSPTIHTFIFLKSRGAIITYWLFFMMNSYNTLKKPIINWIRLGVWVFDVMVNFYELRARLITRGPAAGGKEDTDKKSSDNKCCKWSLEKDFAAPPSESSKAFLTAAQKRSAYYGIVVM